MFLSFLEIEVSVGGISSALDIFFDPVNDKGAGKESVSIRNS